MEVSRVFFVVIFTSLLSYSCTNCEYQINRYIEPLVFEGVVLEKYVDKDNHLYPNVIIDNGATKVHFVPYESFSGQEFFQYVQVGDSVKKDEGTRIIETIRGDELRTFVFKCKEF